MAVLHFNQAIVADRRVGNAILRRVMGQYPNWPDNVRLEIDKYGGIEAVKYQSDKDGNKYGISACSGVDYPYMAKLFRNIEYQGKLYESVFVDGYFY